MNKVESEDLYDNIMHSTIESALYAYMVKKYNKALRQEYRVQETDKTLLREECSMLKARVNKVEGTMKEILESMDKLQMDLNEANASKLGLENRAESTEDQMAILQRQVQELQSQAKGS